MNLKDTLDLSDVQKQMDELQDGANDLVDGAKQLNDGTTKLKTGSKKIDEGAKDLSKYTLQLSNGTKEMATQYTVFNKALLAGQQRVVQINYMQELRALNQLQEHLIPEQKA